MSKVTALATAEPGEWEWLADVESTINDSFTPVSDAVQKVISYSLTVGGTQIPLIVLWLVVAAAVFTVYFKGIQFRGLRTSLDLGQRLAHPVRDGHDPHRSVQP